MKVLLFIAGVVFTAYAGSFQLCVEDNVDYWGADLRNFRANSFSHCAQTCAREQNKGCRSFTYHKGNRHCWLKHTPFGAIYKRNQRVLKSANLNCNKYSTLPAWPQDFRWSNAGTPRGYTCVKIWESRGPPTWNDNYMCWRNDRADPGLRWSMAGPIPGQRCTQIIEGAEPAKYTWKDNYLCVQHNSPYHFAWAYSNGLRDQHRRNGKTCIQWFEPSDPYTWKDNWLCGNRVAPRSAGVLPSWPGDFRWSFAGVPSGYNCDRIWELAAKPQYTWKDNFMCWRNNKADPGIRFNMNGKVTNSKCVQILEPAEPADQTWRDNYICIPPTSPYDFSWAFSNAQRMSLQKGGNSCIQWLEKADPHTWTDNYLCNKKSINPDPRKHSSAQSGSLPSVSHGHVFSKSTGQRSLGCYADSGERAIAGGIRFRGSVAKCAAFARKMHWRVFAVQAGGECFTGPRAHLTYTRYGRGGGCRNGKGAGWRNSVYQVNGWNRWVHGSHYLGRTSGNVRLGCYKDNGSRAISGGVRLRGSVAQCERYARQHGYTVFAVQAGSECFTDHNAEQTYFKFGTGGGCKNGRGAGWRNEVYQVLY